MTKKANIESRTEAVTRDMPEVAEERLEKFDFPKLGMTIEAKSLPEAIKKAKGVIKKRVKSDE